MSSIPYYRACCGQSAGKLCLPDCPATVTAGEPWKVELERLRVLSKRGLLSMTQVDWLFTVIDEARELGKELICEARVAREERDAELEKRCSANLHWQKKSDELSAKLAEKEQTIASMDIECVGAMNDYVLAKRRIAEMAATMETVAKRINSHSPSLAALLREAIKVKP